jgi:hypothetical protein
LLKIVEKTFLEEMFVLAIFIQLEAMTSCWCLGTHTKNMVLVSQRYNLAVLLIQKNHIFGVSVKEPTWCNGFLERFAKPEYFFQRGIPRAKT